MAKNQTKNPSMPVGGVQQWGQATGKPGSNSSIKYGDDLRNGGGKK